MTLPALGLTILSAFLHDGWNLIGERQSPGFHFFVVAFRQLSIPPGIGMAALFLDEQPAPWRWYAVLPLLTGLFLLLWVV